jgi:ubiquitin-like protein Pup
MPEQERKQVQKKGGGDGESSEDGGQVSATSRASELKEEMDEILDEIDSVLEENAEEFVKSYVQKGGE